MFNIRQVNLDNLNSMTKYPSIPTYHKIGDRGILQPELEVDLAGEILIGTEKVDGTNTRVIICPDGCVLLGSREDLLWAKGDLLGNPSMGIVSGLRARFEFGEYRSPKAITVLFGEFYGANVGNAAKQYGKTTTGFRLFDVVVIENYEDILALPREKISSWREHGGQPFISLNHVQENGFGTVPHLFEGPIALPTDIQETYTWLQQFRKSSAVLDETGLAQSEGVVVRTPDRKKIAKIRFEDYERTLRKLGCTK
jgi:hypothetical protein